MFWPGVCSGQLGDCWQNWEDEDEAEDTDTMLEEDGLESSDPTEILLYSKRTFKNI